MADQTSGFNSQDNSEQLGHEHYTHKYVGAHNERRVLSLSTVLMAVLFLAVVFGFRNYLNERAAIARRICEANPRREGCAPIEPVMPIDPRCATRPEHPKCQPVDPTDPPDPGGDPIPPTPPGEDNFTFSGTVTDKDGFTVPAGEVWTFDPAKDTTVEVEANVIVYGVLEMRPNAGVEHTLRFKNVDESKFVGGGMELLEDDTGLWILGDGKLDAIGEKKVGWNRTGTDSTWKSSDELLVAPIAKNDYAFKSFTLGASVPQLDSSLPKAEVLNMTRSVNIEGTSTGKSHVMFMSSQPQTIKYVGFRHLGSEVLGRYPIHFHFMGDASRGSLIEGTVVRDSDHHAYVAHASHGVTFRDTIAYNITDDAYWWDPIKGTGTTINQTHDVTYDHTIAADVNKGPNNAHRLNGYFLAAGTGGTVKDSVAVGVTGSGDPAGFSWPPNDLQIFTFENNVAHNNNHNGIWIWQNDKSIHNINNFIAYSNTNDKNTGKGILSGAYNTNYNFNNTYLYGNDYGLDIHAGNNGSQLWKNTTIKNSHVGAFAPFTNNSGPKWPVSFQCLTINGVVQKSGAIDAKLNILGC